MINDKTSRKINTFMNYKTIKRDDIITNCNYEVASKKLDTLDKIDNYYTSQNIITLDEAMRMISEL